MFSKTYRASAHNTTGSVVFGLALFLLVWLQYNVIAFLAGTSSLSRMICLNRLHLRSATFLLSSWSTLHNSYNSSFLIVSGHLLFTSCLSCLRWYASSRLDWVLVSAHVPALYMSTGITRALYNRRRILRVIPLVPHSFVHLLNCTAFYLILG